MMFRQRNKRYGSNSADTSIMIGILFPLFCIGTTVFITQSTYSNIIIAQDEPGGWFIIIGTALAWIAVCSYFIRNHIFERCYLRYQFCEEGIRCFHLFRGRFLVPWDTVYKYGYCNYANGHAVAPTIYFSQDASELWPKNPLFLQRDLFPLEYRVDAWEAACEYMPEDIRKNLIECIREDRQGSFRRDPKREKHRLQKRLAAQHERELRDPALAAANAQKAAEKSAQAMAKQRCAKITRMANLFKYAMVVSIFAPLILHILIPGFTTSTTVLCISIAALCFGIYSLVGYWGKWQHVYCAYQSMCFAQMTPEETEWSRVIVRMLKLLAIVSIAVGAMMIYLQLMQ